MGTAAGLLSNPVYPVYPCLVNFVSHAPPLRQPAGSSGPATPTRAGRRTPRAARPSGPHARRARKAGQDRFSRSKTGPVPVLSAAGQDDITPAPLPTPQEIRERVVARTKKLEREKLLPHYTYKR